MAKDSNNILTNNYWETKQTLWVVVFHHHYSTATLLGIGNDCLLIQRFDAEGIHDAYFDAFLRLKYLGRMTSLLESDTRTNHQSNILAALADHVGLANLK